MHGAASDKGQYPLRQLPRSKSATSWQLPRLRGSYGKRVQWILGTTRQRLCPKFLFLFVCLFLALLFSLAAAWRNKDVYWTRFPVTFPWAGKSPTCCGLVTDLLRGNWCNGFSPILVRVFIQCSVTVLI